MLRRVRSELLLIVDELLELENCTPISATEKEEFELERQQWEKEDAWRTERECWEHEKAMMEKTQKLFRAQRDINRDLLAHENALRDEEAVRFFQVFCLCALFVIFMANSASSLNFLLMLRLSMWIVKPFMQVLETYSLGSLQKNFGLKIIKSGGDIIYY